MTRGILGNMLFGDDADYGSGILGTGLLSSGPSYMDAMASPEAARGYTGGLLGGLHNFTQDNGQALLQMGAALLDGEGWGGGFKAYANGMQQDQRTRLLKQAQAKEETKAVEARKLATQYGLPAGMDADPDRVFSLVGQIEANKRTRQPTEWDRLTEGLSPEEVTQAKRYKLGLDAKPGSTEYGVSPVWGVDAEGNPTLLQLGKNGTAIQPHIPNGVKLARDPIKVEGPTGTVILDPQTRQQVGFIPKDNAGAARDTALGKADGEAIAGAPNQLAAAETALGVINQVKTHPGREGATGWQSMFPTTNGSQAAGFENLVEQAKSGAFLTAVQQLRGLGAMSEYEAKSATAAINRMNIATSDKDFLKAVQDYETVVLNAKTRAQQLIARRGNSGGGGPIPVGGSQDLGGGVSIRRTR